MKHTNLTATTFTLLAAIVAVALNGIGSRTQAQTAEKAQVCRTTYEQMRQHAESRPDIAAAFGKVFLSQGCGQVFPTVVEPIKRYIAAVEQQAAPEKVDSTTTKPENKAAKIEVLWSGAWYKAQIIEAKDGQYKIHYDGFGNNWDEWVKPDRIRQVTGQNSTPTTQPRTTASVLKVGEYACTGSGGRLMIGLGFKVLPGNRYTDLDGDRRGTFVIAGDKVTFRGGHLDGITGRDLRDNWFTVATQASCGPW
jgi:hypothetical protein